MVDLPKKGYVNLVAAMEKVVSAHEAVIQGVATHAQKESAARQAANHKRDADRALNQDTVSHGT